jgi:hypothetical protein
MTDRDIESFSKSRLAPSREPPHRDSADLNKWISGEHNVFDSHQTPPPSVPADNNIGEKMSSIGPSSRKLEHTGIIALVGGFALVALVCLVLAMRPVEPSRTTNSVSQPSEAAAVFTTARAAGDAGRSAPLTTPPIEAFPTAVRAVPNEPPSILSDAPLAASLRTEAAPRQFTKAAIPLPASRRHSPSYPIRAHPERGEAARLMADELRQMGITPRSSARGVRHDRRRWQAMQQRESLN